MELVDEREIKKAWGPSINDVASLEGGGGVKLTIWGDMRGVGVKENPISSDFMNISRLCF